MRCFVNSTIRANCRMENYLLFLIMVVFNKTKNCVVVENVEIAKTLKDKFAGLTKYDESRAMYFETRFGIHTFGMKFPIDVIICDKEMRVSVLRENLVPNRILFWNPRFPYVLELPIGMIRISGIEVGDRLETNKL